MPAAEVDVTSEVVRGLLLEQFPDLAAMTVEPLAFGWDNAVFRLGSELVVRLPRRAAGADLVEREQRWLPVLAPELPLPVPAPVGLGVPGRGHPWRWSICPWFPGEVSALVPPEDAWPAAAQLGAFLTALHRPAPTAAPPNPVRGGPLMSRDAATRERVHVLGHAGQLQAEVVLAAWADALLIEPWTGPPVWLHGDLHPANLLVHEGCLSAVIDFGDLTGGDPATDLSAAWMLFADEVRPSFREAAGYGTDDACWARARGWALSLAVAYLANSGDNPMMAGTGRRTLRAVLADG